MQKKTRHVHRTGIEKYTTMTHKPYTKHAQITHNNCGKNTHRKFIRELITNTPKKTRKTLRDRHTKPTRQVQKRTQQVHEKHIGKHTNTTHKPCTKHTHKTHTRNAETHTTGSQQGNENTPKKYTSTQQVHKNVVEITQT